MPGPFELIEPALKSLKYTWPFGHINSDENSPREPRLEINDNDGNGGIPIPSDPMIKTVVGRL